MFFEDSTKFEVEIFDMSGIDEILEKGRKLNLERCHVPPKPVNRPIKSCKPRTAEEKPMQINKLQFPERFMHPECHHEADFTLNRSLLTSNDHIRVLSQPRKVSRRKFQKNGNIKIINFSISRISILRIPDVSRRQSQTVRFA